MKKVDDYLGFDIKISSKGRYFPRSNSSFIFSASVNLGGYESLEKAKEAIDIFWEKMDDRNKKK